MSPVQPKDIIRLRKGFDVEVQDFPSYFYPRSSPFDRKTTSAEMHVGDKWSRRTNVYTEQMKLAKGIQDICHQIGVSLDLDILYRFVKHVIRSPRDSDFFVPEGDYVVWRVAPLPDVGYEVFAKTYQPSKERPLVYVSFEILGKHGSMHRTIKPIGRIP